MIILYIIDTSVVLQAVFTVSNDAPRIISTAVTSNMHPIPMLRILRMFSH